MWWRYPKDYAEADGRCPPTDETGTLDFREGEPGARTTLSSHRGGAPTSADTEERRWLALAKALNHAADAGDARALADAPGGLIGRVDLARGY